MVTLERVAINYNDSTRYGLFPESEFGGPQQGSKVVKMVQVHTLQPYRYVVLLETCVLMVYPLILVVMLEHYAAII